MLDIRAINMYYELSYFDRLIATHPLDIEGGFRLGRDLIRYYIDTRPWGGGKRYYRYRRRRIKP